jgi:hypothetical protein
MIPVRAAAWQFKNYQAVIFYLKRGFENSRIIV